jgi:hypothetical protein
MASLGKDMLGLLMSMLSIEDASSLALTCRRALEVFLSRPHWAGRLWREAGITSGGRRRGKGAKKRNEKKKPDATGEKLLEQYRTLHLNRRATYRSLRSLARVMAVAGPRAVSEIIEVRGRGLETTTLPRRRFVTRGDGVTSCNFPIAHVSTQTNELVLGCGTETIFLVDIALAVSRLSSQTHTPPYLRRRGRSMLTATKECTLSVPFSAKQAEDLISRRILCRCGCLLWFEDDVCCP